jgi:LuxR family maltose regulon positive regulatory protein
MRTLLTRARPWLRRVVDQDHALVRSHRELLSSFETTTTPGSVSPTGRQDPAPVGSLLTDREGQVLALLAQMYSTDEIAAELYVSANTVKTHLKGIFGKLCVNRRVDAVRRGRQLGLC